MHVSVGCTIQILLVSHVRQFDSRSLQFIAVVGINLILTRSPDAGLTNILKVFGTFANHLEMAGGKPFHDPLRCA
ncbi:MAG TPA: hypothetical protein DCF63_19235 [Planctomycetaceae bacterium]|nr:hypothetical protein [Planctomycetaceae bacterium]